MTLREFYERAVQIGIENDWRGKGCIDQILARAKQDSSKPGFDRERLWNPYGDTRVAHGDRDTEINSILSNDNIGINALLDGLEEVAPLTIYEADQFRRVRRVE